MEETTKLFVRNVIPLKMNLCRPLHPLVHRLVDLTKAPLLVVVQEREELGEDNVKFPL
jgi:hypothetical protein